jgi:uncharacterized membrane-anchored protein YitT (DUF2179 family)
MNKIIAWFRCFWLNIVVCALFASFIGSLVYVGYRQAEIKVVDHQLTEDRASRIEHKLDRIIELLQGQK